MNDVARANQLIDLFFKDSHTCFVLLDIDFNFIRVNEAYAKVCNLTVDYFIGKNHFELFPSEAEEIFKSVRDSKQKFTIAARPFIYSDHPEWGITYWDWLLEPILDDKGEIDFFVFSLNDVTARVRAENQRDRFFNLSADMLCIANFEGYFVDLSPAWSKTLGFTNEELKSRPFIEFVHPEDRENTLHEAGRLAVDPEATINFLNRYKTKNGGYRWLSWNSVGVQETGQIYAVAHDITELKEQEVLLKQHQLELEELVNERTSALVASESRLEFLLKSSPAVIYTCKADGNHAVTFISENVSSIFGYQPSDFIIDSHFWISNIHPDDRQQAEDNLKHLKDKEYHCQEYRFRLKNGDYVWVLDEFRLIQDKNEKNSEIIGYWADITDRKKIEEDIKFAKDQAVKANQYKSDFLSSMSHELRTPMNAILGFAQLLKMNSTDESEKDNIREIIKAGGHLLDLINEVLDLSKIESGNVEISLEGVRLDDVLEESLALIGPIVTEKNINIDIGNLTTKQCIIKVDYTRFKQVLINLLSNAVKYNVDGGDIKLEVEPASYDMVRISISDTGKGLTKEQQKLLFVPFERLGAETTEVEGTGIGLVITKQLVEMMGGSIGYKMNEGAGSTFWVKVKKGSSDDICKAIDGELVSVADHKSQPKKILYVEDNPANMKLVSDVVNLTNHQLIEAVTGPSGVEAALRHQPDLILLDINLPELDGFDVFRKLQQDPVIRNVPVVALSANAMKSDINKALELGFKDYLTKPINIKTLLSAIEALI